MARGLNLIRTCELRIWKHEANLYELEEHEENTMQNIIYPILSVSISRLKFLLSAKLSFNLAY